MDPEIQRQIEIVEGMISDQRDPDIIRQYLRTQGYETSEQWQEARRAFEEQGVSTDPESRIPPRIQEAMAPNAMSRQFRPMIGALAEGASGFTLDEIAPGVYEQSGVEDLPTAVRLPLNVGGAIYGAPGRVAQIAMKPLQGAGLLPRVFGGSAVGVTEAALTGAAAAPGGQRVEAARQAAPWGLLGAAAGFGGTQARQSMSDMRGILRGDVRAPQILAEAGVPTDVATEGFENLADVWSRGSRRLGESMTRASTRYLEPQRALQVEDWVEGRMSSMPRKVLDFVDEILPGSTARNRTQLARDIYQEIDPEVVQQVRPLIQNILATPGGSQIVQRAGMNTITPNIAEMSQVYRLLRDSDNVPLRALANQVDEALSATSSQWDEAQNLYARGDVANAIDEIASSGVTSAKQMADRLRGLDLQDEVRAKFGEQAYAEYMDIVQRLAGEGRVTAAASTGSGGSLYKILQESVQDKGFLSGVTALAYTLANQFGAAGRTVIQGALGNSRAGRELADQITQLVLFTEPERAIQLIRQAPIEASRTAAARAASRARAGGVGGSVSGLLSTQEARGGLLNQNRR